MKLPPFKLKGRCPKCDGKSVAARHTGPLDQDPGWYARKYEPVGKWPEHEYMILEYRLRQAQRCLSIGDRNMDEPNGLANLNAILADQPHLNSALSVIEIMTILENKGGLMPSEAVAWFREARGKLGIRSIER